MKRLLILTLLLLLILARPARAADVIRVPAEELAAAVAGAQAGDTIEVTGGTFRGNLVIDKPLTLIGIDRLGRDRPTLDAENEGTIVTITAPGHNRSWLPATQLRHRADRRGCRL